MRVDESPSGKVFVGPEASVSLRSRRQLWEVQAAEIADPQAEAHAKAVDVANTLANELGASISNVSGLIWLST